MLKSDQINYLLQLGLKGLKKTESGFNFKCPICGDSNKNESKKRCWALIRKDPNNLIIFCHNCGYSSHFKYFLKQVNSFIYTEYLNKEKEDYIQTLKDGKLFQKPRYEGNINISTPIQYKFKLNQKYFKPAKNYAKAIEFCKKRNILDKIDSLYYCIHPKNICSGMIIFPCYMKDGETLYAFTGRHTDRKVFYIHSKNEAFKVFNLFQVNIKENVYIFESIIDSYTISNSVAALGSDISKNILNRIENPVFIFDNDKTGRIKTKKYLNEKYKCFIPPDNFKFKDFNEALCAGWTLEKLNRLVQDNICSGFGGLTKINFKLMQKQ
jgi:transcription elongation factor Elf1